jgi:energy-converting hydrogenase Eha subunit C
MEVVVIGFLSILATCGWWVVGVWGLGFKGILSVIFVLDSLLTIFLIKYYTMSIGNHFKRR